MPPKIAPVLLAVLLIPGLAARADDPGFLVVVHADNPASSIPRQDLARIFLKKKGQWDEGGEALPVDRNADSAVREAFSRTILEREVAEIEGYWQRVSFAGRDAPPPELAADREVLDFVRRDPGAVGYVASWAALDAGVRALEVTDERGEVIVGLPVPEGLPAGAPEDPPDTDGGGSRPAGDEVVAEHGDVRILLTGSCGPQGQGRRAVVESANPHEPVRVTVETSLWIDGRTKATSERTLTLAPLEEEELGCTRLSGSTENRYALAWVSDAVSHPRHPRHPRRAVDRPAREMVALVAGSTCGRGREGRRRAVINRHPERDVAVDVQVVERVAGRETRRFVRSLRLAPGDEKSLGCSADGRLTTELTVLRAEYR